MIATANDVSKLPPELTRAERLDATFFLDLPGERERMAIWEMYVKQLRLDSKNVHPNDKNWTGAENKACCRLAALLGVPLVEAAEHVIPVAATASEAVERLKTWAAGRCLSADVAGCYRRDSGPETRRRVRGGPSLN